MKKKMPNDESAPATRKDLDALRAEGNQRFDQIDQRFDQIDQRFDRLRNDMIEQMRNMQTEVLRAFHGWARPLEIRLRAIQPIEERLGLLEERVSAIERGRQISPTP
jgi:hypothetical protein